MNSAGLIRSYKLCFAEKGTTYTCAVCPYHKFGELCKVERDKDAFEFIKNSKASIDKYIDIICKKEDMEQLISRERQQYYDELQLAKAEIERLQSILLKFVREINNFENKHNIDTSDFSLIPILEEEKNNLVKQIKAEAIKEFAERLKAETIEVDVSYGYGREHYTEAVAVIVIDNLVKEMVGDTE